MKGIIDIMRKIARKESRSLLTTEIGLVTAIYPHEADDDSDNYQCNVNLKNKKLPDGSDFELRKVPVSTPYMGFASIPNVGDLVLVQFIGGDINAPVITGRLYNDEDRPPANLEDEFFIQHKIDSGGSIKIDADGKIIVTSKNEENIFTVEDDKVSIEHEDHKVIVDVSQEKIIITTTGDVEINSDGNTSIKASGDIELTSDGNTNVSATGDVEVTSNGNINVEATANATVKASGILTLESGDASTWQPCTLPSCLFTGAPHGGAGGGIVKLKGK